MCEGCVGALDLCVDWRVMVGVLAWMGDGGRCGTRMGAVKF
jgi:hypothetical protein